MIYWGTYKMQQNYNTKQRDNAQKIQNSGSFWGREGDGIWEGHKGTLKILLLVYFLSWLIAT